MNWRLVLTVGWKPDNRWKSNFENKSVESRLLAGFVISRLFISSFFCILTQNFSAIRFIINSVRLLNMRIFSDFRLGSLALVGLLLASCAGKAPVVADYEVVPIPLEIKTVQEASFVMKDGTTIYYTVGNEKMRRNAEFLASYVESQTGIRLNVRKVVKDRKASFCNWA